MATLSGGRQSDHSSQTNCFFSVEDVSHAFGDVPSHLTASGRRYSLSRPVVGHHYGKVTTARKVIVSGREGGLYERGLFQCPSGESDDIANPSVKKQERGAFCVIIRAWPPLHHHCPLRPKRHPLRCTCKVSDATLCYQVRGLTSPVCLRRCHDAGSWKAVAQLHAARPGVELEWTVRITSPPKLSRFLPTPRDQTCGQPLCPPPHQGTRHQQ